MADQKQLEILKEGDYHWNKWRREHPDVAIDLQGATLSGVNLGGVNLNRANLSDADLSGAFLSEARFNHANLSNTNLSGASLSKAWLNHTNLSGAKLSDASLSEADLYKADLTGSVLKGANLMGANLCKVILIGADISGANLSGTDLYDADLSGADLNGVRFHGGNIHFANLSETNLTGAILHNANLTYTNLSRADLSNANLEQAVIVGTNIQDAVFKDCRIYGVSVWDPRGTPANTSGGLIITPEEQPDVTVDSLEVAQFVYLLLNNEKIRDVLDTIGRKGVLILGRFTPDRKQVLDALRDRLRQLDYVPIMFDFEGAKTKDFTETVRILAGMSRFIIADITSPKSSPLELQATVPDYKVPFVPIIQGGEEPFSMFANLQSYPWMLDLLEYKDSSQLIAVFEQAIIQPALIKADEINLQKAEKIRKRYARDYCR